MNDDVCVLRIGCKINLYLEITGRRDDGYHELRSLFLPLDEPFDELRISPAPEGASMLMTCSDPSLENQSNILLKAYRAFSYVTSTELDFEAHLEKRIPLGAGLGGGSANAAALLLYMNARVPRPLSAERLARLATCLGADVPFFLQQHPAWAEGIGERLKPAPELWSWLSGLSLVLACPEIQVSTGRAYGAWDAIFLENGGQNAPQTLTVSEQSLNQSFCAPGITLWNDFEAVVFPAYPELRALKEFFLRRGAAGAVMSGSGATVFALFREAREAEAAAQELKSSSTTAYIRHFC